MECSQLARGKRLWYNEEPESVRAYAWTGPRGPSVGTRWTRWACSNERSVVVSVAGLTPERQSWIGPNRNVPYFPRRETTHTAHFFPTTSINPIGGHGQMRSQDCDTMSVRSAAL